MAFEEQRETGGATQRLSVTLPAFTVFEIDGLVNVYGPTRAQVVATIVESWLHDNEQKIDHRKRRYAEFRAVKRSRNRRTTG